MNVRGFTLRFDRNIDDAVRADGWVPLVAKGLSQDIDITAIWADPRDPKVLVVGTTSGLWWSNDGGDSFTGSNWRHIECRD
jgi:hypothetical protein